MAVDGESVRDPSEQDDGTVTEDHREHRFLVEEDLVVMVAREYQRAIHNLLESSSFVPKEWRLMADAWIESARQGRENFREAVGTSYTLAEQFVERLGEGGTAKA